MKSNFQSLLDETKQEILAAIKHLEYSYAKTQQLSTEVTKLSSEDLESWEGLVARFGRVSDLFLSRYLKTYVLQGDPGFRGAFRDFVDQAEKLNLIDSADQWMSIRELRNISVHEYSKLKIPLILQQVRDFCPKLIDLKKKI